MSQFGKDAHADGLEEDDEEEDEEDDDEEDEGEIDEGNLVSTFNGQCARFHCHQSLSNSRILPFMLLLLPMMLMMTFRRGFVSFDAWYR